MGIIPPPDLAGRQLAVATSTAYQGTLTTSTALTSLSVTFTVGARPVMVRGLAPYVGATNAGATALLTIADGSGVAQRSAAATISTAAGLATLAVEELITTPGTYTRRLELAKLAGSGSVSNNVSPSGAATVVSSLEAVER